MSARAARIAQISGFTALITLINGLYLTFVWLMIDPMSSVIDRGPAATITVCLGAAIGLMTTLLVIMACSCSPNNNDDEQIAKYEQELVGVRAELHALRQAQQEFDFDVEKWLKSVDDTNRQTAGNNKPSLGQWLKDNSPSNETTEPLHTTHFDPKTPLTAMTSPAANQQPSLQRFTAPIALLTVAIAASAFAIWRSRSGK